MTDSRFRLTHASEIASITRTAQIGKSTVLMQTIENGIRLAASQGVNVASVDIPKGTHQLAVEACIRELRAAGYSVEQHQGSDQRDNDEWNYLAISWKT